MKITFRISIMCALCIVLASCRSADATMDSMMKLRKGETPDKVQAMLDREPSYDFSVSYQGKEHPVKVYQIVIGKVSTSSSGPGGQTYMSTSNISSNYIFLFGPDQKLIYWGFLQEFSKDEDPFVAGIAPVLQDKYFAHLREKGGYWYE